MIHNTKVLSVRVSDEEAKDFYILCHKHNISVQEMLHALVTDALWEEKDIDNVRCGEQERCSKA